MDNKVLFIGAIVGVFFVGLGIGYAVFAVPMQQQLQSQQEQITELQAEVSSLKGTIDSPTIEPMMRLGSASASFMQGAAMMQQGANMMMQGQDVMMQDRMQGTGMMNLGADMMQEGFDMMQQASRMMQETRMPSLTGPMTQGFNDMMQSRQHMMDAANMMMQARQSMMNMHQQGMMGPMMGQQQMSMMMQNVDRMSQGMAMMQRQMSQMQQAQGMMGMQPMMGMGGFGFMGPMMMGSDMQGPMMGQMMQHMMSQGMMMGMHGMDQMMMNKTSPMFMRMMNVPTVEPLTYDNVKKAAEDFVKSLDADLAMRSLMEFEKNFYFIVYEKDTGIGAFEMLVWKDVGMMSGIMHPEPGPNMMWNTKYSMIQFTPPVTEMTITRTQARSLAQDYLDANLPGTTSSTLDQFYGYYTVHTMKDGKISGMLSVNGFTGQVWYHWWHGEFVR